MMKEKRQPVFNPFFINLRMTGDTDAEFGILQHYRIIDKIDIMVRARVEASSEAQNELIKDILNTILWNLKEGLYKPEKGTFITYVHCIAKSKIVSYLGNE